MDCSRERPWKLSFAGWTPRAPQDERSPWAYLPGVTPDSTFETCEAAIHILETVQGLAVEDDVRPLFWPIREMSGSD